ncbi:MAG: cobalt ECF transporter T component CbiQ, partial [Chloroflexota bacterium]
AGLPALIVGRLLLAEGLFLALAVLGVTISIGSAPPEAALWSSSWGPLWLGSSWASVETALRLAARALGCAATLNFLALTTPLVDLIDLGRRLWIPALLVDLMALVYRFIFALLDSLTRMRVAQECRLGYATVRRSMASAGVLGSRLFVDAFLRSQRLQRALEGRGYCGELRVLPAPYSGDPILYWLGVGMVATLLAAWVWL